MFNAEAFSIRRGFNLVPFSMGGFMVISINSEDLGKEALLSLCILLSEAHGRVCKDISECCDMYEATRLARKLEGLSKAHELASECVQ